MELRNEMEIDIIGLFLQLKTKIWIILTVTVVCALGGYVGSRVVSTPVYTATTQVYIRQTNDEGMDSNNLTVATQVRRDCQVIMKGESVTKEVISRLGLRTTPSALGNAITINTEDNTRILNLSYTGADAEQAALIINTVREVSADRIDDLIGKDLVQTVYEAETPRAKSTVNIKRNTTVAAVVGAILSAVVIIVVFLLDDTIRNEDDVEKHLGLSTLGVIPVSKDLLVTRGSRKGKSRQPAALQNKRRVGR